MEGCEEEVVASGGRPPTTDADARRKLLRKKMRLRANTTRIEAVQAGYGIAQKGDFADRIGRDGMRCVLSKADAKRLSQYMPATPSSTTFSAAEFKARLNLGDSCITSGALATTQMRTDAVLRSVVNQLVLRAVENSKTAISAYDVKCVLRPYRGRMLFTSIDVPDGLVEHAQKEGALPYSNADGERRKKAKATAERNAAAFNHRAEAIQARKDRLKEARASKVAASRADKADCAPDKSQLPAESDPVELPAAASYDYE